MPVLSTFVILVLAVLFFGTIFGMFYLYLTARTRERLAIIQSGRDPNMFKVRRNNLKYGMVIFSVVLGMTLGDLMPFRYAIGVPLGVMLGGLSLVVYYFIIEKQLDKKEAAKDLPDLPA